jgi:hypothetical protein
MSNFWESGTNLGRRFINQRVDETVALVLFWVPTLIGFVSAVRRKQYVTTLAAAAYVGSILVLRPMIARYFLPLVPLLVLWFFDGVRWLLEALPRLRHLAPNAALGAAVVLVPFNLAKDVRLVYRLHHPSRLAKHESWTPLLEATDFLHQNAGDTDLFVSETDSGMLSYLSRVPYLGIGKSLANHAPLKEAVLEMLDDYGVTLVVFRRDEPAPHFEVVRQAVVENPQFDLIFQSKRYAIYRRKAGETVGGAS